MKDADLRMAYLRETLPLLWPRTDEDLIDRHQYLLVPGRWRPRLLVPRWAPRAAATAVRTHVRAAEWALRAGLLRTVIEVPKGEDGIDGYLSDLLDRHVVVAPYVRPAGRVNRKPVLQVLGLDGELLAFAKIGHTDLSRDLVRAERDALKLLADAPLKVVAAPRVMHYGVWRGLDVLVCSPLIGGRRRVPRPLLEAAAREIHSLDRQGAWHGDFSPWNMAAADSKRLLVWDWERFNVGVPYGYDLLHHYLQGALRKMPVPEAARSCLAQAVRILPGVDRPRTVAAGYLAELAQRDDRFAVDVEGLL